MQEITDIKPQRNGKRVNVYLDGKFGFGIDLENLVKFGLTAGRQLSEGEIEEIVGKAEFQKTLDKLLRFAMLRPRSVLEIKQWLKRKKVHETFHKKLFNRLKRLVLVNDEKFARWWVKQRMQFRPRAKRFMIYELRIKGIDKEIISKIMDEVEIDEVKVAKDMIKNRRDSDPKKTAAYLARKGFDWDVIKRVKLGRRE